MKRSLATSIIILFSLIACANDTLTNAQVYNFNVGDTFEYMNSSENIDIGMPLTITHSRRVLMQKTFSPNLDTIFLGYGSPGGSISQWETITDLDSFPILQIPITDTTCNNYYGFDTTTYSGYPSNSLNIYCFESGLNYRYTKGLGETLSGWAHIGNTGYGTVASSKELTYYSNGITHVGTAYVPPQPFPTRYIPLPETCAIWTRTINGSYSGLYPYGTITEQIRTGNKIQKDGKTFVELICRIQNDITHQFTPDSLIGYFYNDSANLAARFVTDTNGISSLLCSFTGHEGQQCSYNAYYTLDSVLIGGVYRTFWECNGSYDCNEAKISGIGKLSGLIPINHLYSAPGHETCGSLSSFCVCGQKLYPLYTSLTCDLLSNIPDLEITDEQFTIYPNPASASITLTGDKIAGSDITITDVTGRIVFNSKIESAKLEIKSADYTAGIYFVAVVYKNGNCTVKKLVIEN